MASVLPVVVISRLNAVVFELLMVKSVDSLEVCHANAETVRDELFDELTSIHNGISNKALKDAFGGLKSGIEALAGGATDDEALSHFTAANTLATTVFSTTPPLEIAVMCTKIQIICVLFRNSLFHENVELADAEALTLECHDKLFNLVRCSEVQSSMSYYENKTLFNLPGAKATNFNNLAEVSHIKVYVEKYSGRRCALTGPSGKPFSLMENVDRRSRSGHKDAVTAVTVSAGRLYTCSEDTTVKVFDAASLAEISTLQVKEKESAGEALISLAVSDLRVFVGTDRDLIRVWNKKTLNFEGILRGHGGCVNALVACGDRLYSGSNDKTIKVWNGVCLSEVSSLTGHTNAVQSLAVSGNLLFSGSWDSAIKVWDLKTFTEVAEVSGHTLPVRALVVSGGRLYSSSRDKTIKVWDLASFAPLATLTGHKEWVASLAVCGDRLYSGSDDGSVKVWDTETFSEVVTIKGHSNWVRAVAVSGGTLYSGSWDCTVHIRLIG